MLESVEVARQTVINSRLPISSWHWPALIFGYGHQRSIGIFVKQGFS